MDSNYLIYFVVLIFIYYLNQDLKLMILFTTIYVSSFFTKTKKGSGFSLAKGQQLQQETLPIFHTANLMLVDRMYETD